ncbi:magnesium (Mg2+)-dependent deoxyribonuclease [Treponema paraluiscuniculi Cuniculi A]|uniref:Magnesium (Mg2+)-dependent deoxyribonuclease n=3 Tax=Treponema paraluiscuniculi TaxID=53435 RepID=F7XR66_TREPU|nr:magnesium (Mg2+)-dependent deoxyribonuclease [Treponema paraluiscuniculi Cuniculi A]WKC72847.1 magnesium (Mg2+)-dependent deoxyribonuclease [Treponema paraluiscuniculi]
MEVGTRAGDYQERKALLLQACAGRSLPSCLHFSVGVWPAPEPIAHPETALSLLRSDVRALCAEQAPYRALGECGLDRHWNGPQVACKARKGSGVRGTPDLDAEEYLFKAQLSIAKAQNLPLIIHSRDAFEPTLRCLDSVGWRKGVMHCFSYGVVEAHAFLERGLYISCAGTLTYAKTTSELLARDALIRSIPLDRLLLETDTPYLAPVPHRGTHNRPEYVRHTYALVANILGISEKALAQHVFANCCALFEAQEPTEACSQAHAPHDIPNA